MMGEDRGCLGVYPMSYILGICVLFYVWGSEGVFGDEPEDSASDVVGVVNSTSPSLYAVANIDGREKKLYVKGDIFYSDKDINNAFRIIDIKPDMMVLQDVVSKALSILKPGEKVPIKGKDIIFEKIVEAEVIEYRYKPSEKLTREEKEDFAVKNLDRKKIVLEKTRDKEVSKSPKEIESSTLNAEFFEKVVSRKIGNDIWDIDRKSARQAVRNVGATLRSVIKNIEPKYSFGEGPSLKFNSNLGQVVLNRDGFLVQSLAVAKLTDSFGIRKGDLIKNVNGCRVNSLLGLYRAYENLTSDKNAKSKIVSVDIVRDGKEKTLIYKIK